MEIKNSKTMTTRNQSFTLNVKDKQASTLKAHVIPANTGELAGMSRASLRASRSKLCPHVRTERVRRRSELGEGATALKRVNQSGGSTGEVVLDSRLRGNDNGEN
jgi:hypothetical protein